MVVFPWGNPNPSLVLTGFVPPPSIDCADTVEKGDSQTTAMATASDPMVLIFITTPLIIAADIEVGLVGFKQASIEARRNCGQFDLRFATEITRNPIKKKNSLHLLFMAES